MGRPSQWRTFSRSHPSAHCSPALLVPNALETLWENGWPVRSAASATAAPSRNLPITNRRSLVSLAGNKWFNNNQKPVSAALRPQVELHQHKSGEISFWQQCNNESLQSWKAALTEFCHKLPHFKAYQLDSIAFMFLNVNIRDVVGWIMSIFSCIEQVANWLAM